MLCQVIHYLLCAIVTTFWIVKQIWSSIHRNEGVLARYIHPIHHIFWLIPQLFHVSPVCRRWVESYQNATGRVECVWSIFMAYYAPSCCRVQPILRQPTMFILIVTTLPDICTVRKSILVSMGFVNKGLLRCPSRFSRLSHVRPSSFDHDFSKRDCRDHLGHITNLTSVPVVICNLFIMGTYF